VTEARTRVSSQILNAMKTVLKAQYSVERIGSPVSMLVRRRPPSQRLRMPKRLQLRRLPEQLAHVPGDGRASDPMARAVVLVRLRPRPNRFACRTAQTTNTAKTAKLFLERKPPERMPSSLQLPPTQLLALLEMTALKRL